MTEVRVNLVRGKFSWLWVCEKCPLCGGKHSYGGGSLKEEPVLGERLSKCVLIEETPVELVPVGGSLMNLYRVMREG